MNNKWTKLEKSWILYDVGNSAFVLLISTIIPIYFNYLAQNGGVSETDAVAYWGYTASIVTIIVAILGPIFGSLSDFKNFKLPIFLTTVLVGVIGCSLLSIPMNWLLFLFIFAIAKIGYNSSLIFYDSMLVDITSTTRSDKVSSVGYALGYIGSCIPFIVSLVIVLFYEKINMSFEVAMALAFIITGLWWLVMTIPLLKNYKQDKCVENNANFKNCFKNILINLKDMSKNKYVLLFLIAFFFFIDGVYTIIDMATIYGTSLGLDQTMLLIALLVTQIVAFPFAILFGFLSSKIRISWLLITCIIAYTGIATFAIFMQTQLHFWILAVLVGMFQGGIQALSRSYFAKIIPEEKAGSYFSLLDICGKGASFLGTFLVSLFTQITNSTNKGITVLSVMFVIGLVIFIIADIGVKKSGKKI